MKLFVFDVDGTLTADGFNISSENKEAIQERMDAGDLIAIASGRPYSGINKYLSLFDGDNKYAIGSNGAIIQDKDGKIIGRNGLIFDDLLHIRKRYFDIENKGGQIYAYDKNGNVICFKKSVWTDDEVLYNGVKVTLIDETSLKSDETILKVMLCAPKGILSSFEIDKEDKDKYNIVFSDPKYLEFMSKDADKSTGVAILSKELNISKDDIYCFGDQQNDYLMIKDYNGIAMGNAIDECKTVAKHITLDVNENGIAYALEHFID